MFEKLDGENEEQFIWRIGQAKDNGVLDADWKQVADIINREYRTDETDYKSEAAYRKQYQQAKKFYEAGVFNNLGEEDYFKELQLHKRDVQKEKIKLQTEKLEYSKWLREDARDELITEKICEAISALPPLTKPQFQIGECKSENSNNKEYLLCFGDCHYGIEFELKDLLNRIINAYSEEIFEKRMCDMMGQVVAIIREKNIQTLNIYELGDGIQGILRLNSQLMKLKYGIIESSILYANYLSEWLNTLSEYVKINFHMVMDSNHNQLRICNAPKNAFSDENMSKIIVVFLKKRLEQNPNIVIKANPTGMNFDVIANHTVLGLHGEVKDLESTMNNYSRINDIKIDYVIGAHCHHSCEKEVGINSEVISIRSIIGVDPYGLSLQKTSNAGASLFEFDEEKGLTCEYKIKL